MAMLGIWDHNAGNHRGPAVRPECVGPCLLQADPICDPPVLHVVSSGVNMGLYGFPIGRPIPKVRFIKPGFKLLPILIVPPAMPGSYVWPC